MQGAAKISIRLGCPRCGARVARIHRGWLDGAVSAFRPVLRFRCGDPSCGWHGLLDGTGMECSVWEHGALAVALLAVVIAALIALLSGSGSLRKAAGSLRGEVAVAASTPSRVDRWSMRDEFASAGVVAAAMMRDLAAFAEMRSDDVRVSTLYVEPVAVAPSMAGAVAHGTTRTVFPTSFTARVHTASMSGMRPPQPTATSAPDHVAARAGDEPSCAECAAPIVLAAETPARTDIERAQTIAEPGTGALVLAALALAASAMARHRR